eukprot:TRINITY_DN377_c0_g1_i1.p2 TRINITY_DN377_c0_g1~~TRINITY_DN377_c0_g1_i1.p2  ORF type:complete len:134 (-),score=33.93 TRINITY_DN377_c0_g1_i1:60-428(-)
MSSSVPAPSVPRVAGRSSLKVDLGPAGGSKWWCTCGLSASQPWCDGSHKHAPGGFAPLEVKVTDEIRGRGFCSCKLTKNPPFCDGSHRRLPEQKADPSLGFMFVAGAAVAFAFAHAFYRVKA